MPDLSERDLERIAEATERAVMRATLRALGYVALAVGGAWLAVTLLAATLAYLTPAPGHSVGIDGWLFVLVVLLAVGAGTYYVVRSIRAALK
jgi:hypothetical protein